MTRDEIMELANGTAGFHWMDEAHIQRFASVLIAAEREACAKQVEPKGPRPCKCVSCDGLEFCGSIKVSAVEEWDSKTECAAAIRSRSEK